MLCWSLIQFIGISALWGCGWPLSFESLHGTFCCHDSQCSGRKHSDKFQLRSLWALCLKFMVFLAIATYLHFWELKRTSTDCVFQEALRQPWLKCEREDFCMMFSKVVFGSSGKSTIIPNEKITTTEPTKSWHEN